MSHPSRGAWIEMAGNAHGLQGGARRTPHGVRGLKSAIQQHTRPHHASHPSRGAWIEIAPDERARGQVPRRTPHGVRGLKYRRPAPDSRDQRRTPHGVRGLKSTIQQHTRPQHASHPSRGAWIEISTTSPRQSRSAASHPSRGAWIEIGRGWCGHHRRGRRTPHGVRGLKYHDSKENPMNNVAPLTGCVD